MSARHDVAQLALHGHSTGMDISPGSSDDLDDFAAEVLRSLRGLIAKRKKDGIGRNQDAMLRSERIFLEKALQHLKSFLRTEAFEEALAIASAAIHDPDTLDVAGLSSEERAFRRNWFRIGRSIGLHRVSGARSAGGPAAYILAQILAVDPKYWEDPVKALLFGACQEAVHLALWREFENNERDYSRGIIRALPEVIRKQVVDPLISLDVPVFLQFATACMEKGSDLQGSDIAVVVGSRLFGKPVWRVVLLQAKRERKPKGGVSVGYRRGAQMDEVLATGMGSYLFYRAPDRNRIFVPTVRTAEDVFEDVWKGRKQPEFRNLDPCEGTAMDLASFIALEMTRSDGFGPGRVFPDAAAVARALSIGREKPVKAFSEITLRPPAHLIVASTIPGLDVLHFRARMEDTYPEEEIYGFPDDLFDALKP